MLPVDAELEMETAPETAMFRKTLLMRWQSLNATDPGELRSLLAILVTHAPVAAVGQFVGVSKALLASDPGRVGRPEDVVELIMCTYPRPTWSKTPPLARQDAADDHAWRTWVHEWITEFSATTGEANSLTSRLAKFFHIRDEVTMLDPKTLASSALKLGQIALQVYMGAEAHRQRRIAEGGEGPSPMTLESVMREAQCHIPGLEVALAGIMGDEQQARECIDAITRTPDLVGILKVLSGMVMRAPEAAPIVAQASAVPAPVARGTELVRQGPPAFRADFAPRKPPASQEATVTPTAAEPKVSAVRAPCVQDELAALESWANECSQSVRQRGERLAEQLAAFLAQTGLRLQGAPAPAFVDPPATAEAQAAATPIQPTHFGTDTDQAVDAHVKGLIERTKRRLERRYDLDDQFLAWLEDAFESVQAAASRERTAAASAA